MPDVPEQGHGGRILVADDEPHIRRVLQTMLAQSGFDVVEVTDGAKAIAAFEAQDPPFDVVLLDLMMPGATGLEVLSRIRAGNRSRTPVIILTAKGQDADRDAAIAGGADDFMTKPFSPKKLLARIHEILEG